VALSMAREEAWAWCMAGAKGLSLLTATDLAAGSYIFSMCFGRV
jgi:hypothetical protein